MDRGLSDCCQRRSLSKLSVDLHQTTAQASAGTWLRRVEYLNLAPNSHVARFQGFLASQLPFNPISSEDRGRQKKGKRTGCCKQQEEVGWAELLVVLCGGRDEPGFRSDLAATTLVRKRYSAQAVWDSYPVPCRADDAV